MSTRAAAIASAKLSGPDRTRSHRRGAVPPRPPRAQRRRPGSSHGSVNLRFRPASPWLTDLLVSDPATRTTRHRDSMSPLSRAGLPRGAAVRDHCQEYPGAARASRAVRSALQFCRRPFAVPVWGRTVRSIPATTAHVRRCRAAYLSERHAESATTIELACASNDDEGRALRVYAPLAAAALGRLGYSSSGRTKDYVRGLAAAWLYLHRRNGLASKIDAKPSTSVGRFPLRLRTHYLPLQRRHATVSARSAQSHTRYEPPTDPPVHMVGTARLVSSKPLLQGHVPSGRETVTSDPKSRSSAWRDRDRVGPRPRRRTACLPEALLPRCGQSAGQANPSPRATQGRPCDTRCRSAQSTAGSANWREPTASRRRAIR